MRMENKKYKLTDETIDVKGKTLYRIEALKDYGEIKNGDKVEVVLVNDAINVVVK